MVDADLTNDARGSAYAALRAGGARLGDAWGHGETYFDGVMGAINAARSTLSTSQLDSVDTLELCLVGRWTRLADDLLRQATANVHRGAYGLRLRHGDRELLRAPTEMIARNESFTGLLDRFRGGSSSDPVPASEVEAWAIHANQLLVQLRPTVRVVNLTRGGRLRPPSVVTHGRVEALYRGLLEWMTNQIGPDGRMIYKYWPSRGEESSANNMIRQWLATLCLVRAGKTEGWHKGAGALATQNLEYNLRSSYHEEEGLGLIDCNGKVKLGAVALAALTIVEHPDRHLYAAVERALRRMVDRLWNEDGSFTTFYRPEGRNDNQNFYPGEALVLWAVLYKLERDAGLLARIMRSFTYYRAWHLAQRNPAFVPWHTQAYHTVWEITADPSLAHFVLSTNDWLLGMQQWESAVYPEMMGQFYNPSHPEYGPPHASSTGVYLEGLIDALSMAQATGDKRRADAYRLAVVRGLRSLIQLQFADDVDMFYIGKKDRVRGALRTTTYDNTIRVDSVQHSLMAVLKILDRFQTDEYALEPLRPEPPPVTS